MAVLIVLLISALAIWIIANNGLFHTLGYYVSIGQTANTDMTAIQDDIVPITGNSHFLPYENYQMVMAYVSSATLTRARINSGTIRQVNPSYIRPISVSTLPPNNPNLMWLYDDPFQIVAHEEVQCEATSGLSMGNEDAYALYWWQVNYQTIPQGRIYKLRWTASTTLTKSKWITISYTLETGLPAGQYTVVDSEAQSSNSIAHRLIFDNQVYRPGTLSLTSLSNRNPYRISMGALGKWGDFYTYSLPRIQMLANAGDTSEEGYLSVVKIG